MQQKETGHPAVIHIAVNLPTALAVHVLKSCSVIVHGFDWKAIIFEICTNHNDYLRSRIYRDFYSILHDKEDPRRILGTVIENLACNRGQTSARRKI